jgi:HEAT repeat protein
LLRGIIAQWFGVYQRENQWEQGDAITLYQAMVHRQLSDSLGSMKSYAMPDMPASIYDRFGVNTWNGWLAGWEKWEDKAIRTIISDSRNSILKELPAVISWEDYAKYWYRQSGQPLFNIPTVNFGTEDTTASTTVPSDSVAYNVFYTLNEAEGQLKLTFEATHGEFKDLTTLKAYEIYPNEGDTSEVTFTGHRDSVMLQVDPMISTLRLETSDIPDLHLNEYKPAPFLIYEIQNDSTTTQRANAARKLGYHADNPDLQLAIQDFMENESDTEVRAALLHSLADITNGATGTEQIFLEALDSKYTSIRNAALMALQNYQGNPTVRDRAQKLALNADDFTFFRKATQVYSTLASADEFRNFAESVTNQDTTGHKSIFVIQQLANMGEVEEAVAKAELFTGDEYRYNIRSMALRILIQHDHTPADWLNRAKELMDTSDPRIRFLVVQGLGRNLDQQVTNYLKEYLQDEYDARVYRKIEQVLSQT